MATTSSSDRDPAVRLAQWVRASGERLRIRPLVPPPIRVVFAMNAFSAIGEAAGWLWATAADDDEALENSLANQIARDAASDLLADGASEPIARKYGYDPARPSPHGLAVPAHPAGEARAGLVTATFWAADTARAVLTDLSGDVAVPEKLRLLASDCAEGAKLIVHLYHPDPARRQVVRQMLPAEQRAVEKFFDDGLAGL